MEKLHETDKNAVFRVSFSTSSAKLSCVVLINSKTNASVAHPSFKTKTVKYCSEAPVKCFYMLLNNSEKNADIANGPSNTST